HVDVISRRIGQRTVDAENRELNLLPRLKASINDQPVRRVPTFHNGAAALTKCARQFTVYPDLGVIIERSFENSSGAFKIHTVYALRNREVDAIPIEAEPTGRPSSFERRRIEHLPFRVVEIRRSSVRRKIVRLDRPAGRLVVWASRLEVDR